MKNTTECGSANPEYFNDISNIDNSDPNPDYVGCLPYDPIRKYVPKDEILGDGECFFYGD